MQVSFKHKIYIDIGASSPRGTMKIEVKSDKNEKDEFTIKRFVNGETGGFKDENAFVDKVYDALKTVNSRAKKLWGEKLTGVAVFLPSMVNNNKVLLTSNLRNQQGQPLKNIDFSQLNERAKKGLDVSNNFKFSAAKDLAGAGFSALKMFLAKQAIPEGSYYSVVLTGGGFGAVNLKRNEKDTITIETSESGYNPAYDSLKGHDCRFSQLGASVKYMFDNFLNGLGIGVYFEALRQTGRAEIILNDEFALDNKVHKQAVSLLKHISYWQVDRVEDGKTFYKINPNKKEEILRSRIATVNTYAYAISQYAITKINDSCNKIFLVGPLALAIDGYIRKNPEEFNGALNLPDLVNFHLNNRIKELDLFYTNFLKDDFEIICDKNFTFDNNTFGADLLLRDNAKPIKNRGSNYIYKLK